MARGDEEAVNLEAIINRVGPEDTEVMVSLEEFSSLLQYCHRHDFDPKPEPPIKSRRESRMFGWFSSDTSTSVEYDHHAPDYLRQLDEWRQRQDNRDKGPQVLRLYTPYGSVEVKVRQDV